MLLLTNLPSCCHHLCMWEKCMLRCPLLCCIHGPQYSFITFYVSIASDHPLNLTHWVLYLCFLSFGAVSPGYMAITPTNLRNWVHGTVSSPPGNCRVQRHHRSAVLSTRQLSVRGKSYRQLAVTRHNRGKWQSSPHGVFRKLLRMCGCVFIFHL